MSIAQPVPLFFYVYNVATFEALLRNFRNCISRIPCHGINRRDISGFEGRASIENLRSSFCTYLYVCVCVSGYSAVIVQASINRRFDTRDTREIRDDNVYPALLPCYLSRFSKWNKNYTSWLLQVE